MEAPKHITEALYKLHKQVRLGWIGREHGPTEELNQGSFALIQLYHTRDAANTYYGEPWNDRGPIFGRSYDRLQRLPILLHLVSPDDVFSGRVVSTLKRWMMPIGQRMLESAREKGKMYQSSIDDLAGEMGTRMYWDAHHGGSATIPEAKKFLTPEDKAVLSGETIRGVENTYVQNFQTGGETLK